MRGRILPESSNPVNRILIWLYRPAISLVLRARVLTIGLALVVLGVTVWPAKSVMFGPILT